MKPFLLNKQFNPFKKNDRKKRGDYDILVYRHEKIFVERRYYTIDLGIYESSCENESVKPSIFDKRTLSQNDI